MRGSRGFLGFRGGFIGMVPQLSSLSPERVRGLSTMPASLWSTLKL